MCESCGCGATEVSLTNLATGRRQILGEHPHTHADGTRHSHDHDHDHVHVHEDATAHSHGHERGADHAHPPVAVVELNARILDKNDRIAERNRAWFQGREILALNLMSAPGAGKTTLLEKTLAALTERQVFVLEGDQATDRDGARMQAAGATAVQINTGRGCHLDAEMVARGLAELKPTPQSLLFIENVGNLVCPALFDLGEAKRVAILSVTEGDDKPIKYPHMFRAADLMLLNKTDLLRYVDFDPERAIAHARAVNPAIEVLQLSARTGNGMAAWHDWISHAQKESRTAWFTTIASSNAPADQAG
ncbi:MAG: hydrogenase nickel incorporation protein HypB [Stellaceae bacterium]